MLLVQTTRCQRLHISLARFNKEQVNATGTQFGVFEGEDNSIPPIAMGSHLDTVATGGKFDGPLGVSLPADQYTLWLT